MKFDAVETFIDIGKNLFSGYYYAMYIQYISIYFIFH